MNKIEYYEDTEYFYDTLKKMGIPTENEFALKFPRYETTRTNTSIDDYIIESNDNYEFDLIFSLKTDIKPTSYEVKNDNRGRDTGNIAIEGVSRGRDSGITTSTATFWAIRFKYYDSENLKNIDVFYLINRERLVMMIIDKKYFTMVESKNGNTLALFKYNLFEKEIQIGKESGDGSKILHVTPDTLIEKNNTILNF